MDRRGFLKSMLAAGIASYVVTSAGVLMPVRRLITHSQFLLYGDGIHDDTEALQAWIDGKPVVWMDGLEVGGVIKGCKFLTTSTLHDTGKSRGIITHSIFEYRGEGPFLDVHNQNGHISDLVTKSHFSVRFSDLIPSPPRQVA